MRDFEYNCGHEFDVDAFCENLTDEWTETIDKELEAKLASCKKSHLFDCLTDKQKEKAKRKGIRKAKREDRIAKINKWFSK